MQLNNTLSSTSTSQALTAGQGKVLNDQAFGVGQTWQPTSLVKGTTYTNTSSKPIVVFAYFTQTTVNHMVALYCGEAIIDRLEVWGTVAQQTLSRRCHFVERFQLAPPTGLM